MKQLRNKLLCALLALTLLFTAAQLPAFAEATKPQPTQAAHTEPTQPEKHRHTFSAWTVQRPANTKKNGALVRVCSVCGETQTKRIARVKSVAVQSMDMTFTVKDKDGKALRSGQDYTVKYQNNKKVGVATAIISGTGKYAFRLTRSFRILPQRTAFTKFLPSATKATLQWQTVPAQADGYQIQYAADAAFKTGAQLKTVENKRTAELVLQGLQEKTTYYVRIRTFKTVDARTFVSKWSKTKHFTTPADSPYAIDGQVPKSKAVRASYFDDVVFVGDSISEGLRYYEASNNVLGKAQFLTAVSLSATNALWAVSSRSVHPRYNGQKMKVEDAIPLTGAKKVYIMLGMNDIISVGVDRSVENFTTLCNKILEKSPDVQIYVESVTPRTYPGGVNDSKLNNKNITAYNRKLAALCQKRDWYFVNVAEVMFDANGCLNASYCSDPNSMGMHFSFAGCKVWVDYLYTHTA